MPTKMTYDKKWMRVGEAAEYLSKRYAPVPVSFVRRLIQKRAVPFIYVGRAKFVEASDLDVYIEGRVELPVKKVAEKTYPTGEVTICLTATERRELKTIARCAELKTMNAAIHHCLNVAFRLADTYDFQPRMRITPVDKDLLPPRRNA